MMKIDTWVNQCKGKVVPEYKWLIWKNSILRGGKVRPHGKNGFLVKCPITKNKGRPIRWLDERFLMMLTFVKLSYGLVTLGDKKTRISPIKVILSPKSNSFCIVCCRRIWRGGEGHKSLGDHSGQINHHNLDLQVGGRFPNLTHQFWWITFSD